MNVKINDNLFSVKPVLTSKDIQNGMMGKKFDRTFDGMLFLMKNGPHSFWMKNCIVHLDIIFIDGNQITNIHHNCKPCHTENCESYKGNGDMILELPGGDCKKYNIKEGDLIDLQP
jgi:uncharacterized membrane protein (UPF0127 family)